MSVIYHPAVPTEPYITIDVPPEWMHGWSLHLPMRLSMRQAGELYNDLLVALNQDHPVP